MVYFRLDPRLHFAGRLWLASACEGHLFGGGYVHERVMAVRNVEGMTAVNGEVADVFVRMFRPIRKA
jgi:hypothetical protein